MKTTSAHHATIVFERTYSACVERVFGAFADPMLAHCGALLRTRPCSSMARPTFGWVAVTHSGGAKSDPKFLGEARYHDIVQNRRIVRSKTIDTGGTRLLVALATMDLEPQSSSTKVKLTVQIVSLDSADMIEGTKIGYSGALDNLARELERSPTSACGCLSRFDAWPPAPRPCQGNENHNGNGRKK